MRSKHLLFVMVSCVVLSAPLLPALAQVTGGPAPASRFLSLLAASNDVSTSATEFEDLPDMTASISVRTRVPTCVTATFSGMFQQGVGGGPNGSVSLRALLDDTLMEGHNSFGLIGEPITAGFNIFRSYTFWKCDVARGPHTVNIQWHTHSGAPALFNRARTLVVVGR